MPAFIDLSRLRSSDLGDKDRAFQWLNSVYTEHDGSLINLPADFEFDSLRSDPRYLELLRKIGFPKS